MAPNSLRELILMAREGDPYAWSCLAGAAPENKKARVALLTFERQGIVPNIEPELPRAVEASDLILEALVKIPGVRNFAERVANCLDNAGT